MSSMSSNTSSSNSFSTMVRDFKKTLSDRRMPRTLLILNRLIVLIITTAIILSSILFIEIERGNLELEKISQISHAIEVRNFAQASLNINTNTYVGVANQLVTNVYGLAALNSIMSR